MKWILVVIALLGFGTGAYVLLRPVTVQTVRLEPIVPLPKNFEPTKTAIQPTQKPVSSIKPRPTKPIEPKRTPVIQNQPRVVQSPAIVSPIAQTDQSPKTSTPEATIPEIPSLTIRQEDGIWRLQAGAFRTEINAETLKAKIVARGLLARVTQGTDGIYRVLVGNYASSAAARADSNKVSSLIR